MPWEFGGLAVRKPSPKHCLWGRGVGGDLVPVAGKAIHSRYTPWSTVRHLEPMEVHTSKYVDLNMEISRRILKTLLIETRDTYKK